MTKEKRYLGFVTKRKKDSVFVKESEKGWKIERIEKWDNGCRERERERERKREVCEVFWGKEREKKETVLWWSETEEVSILKEKI
jgi:hypothetical protein